MRAPSQPGTYEQSEPPQYTSFILRCWTVEGGGIRARLVDVHSGVHFPVSDLAELPALVRSLVTDMGQHS